jgi:hypothetical protein
MSLTEVEREIKEVLAFKLAYEGNFMDAPERLNKGEMSVEKMLNIINNNKENYYILRRYLELIGRDVSELPSKLNYMERRN